MNEYAISVEKIFKNFGNVQALRDVSFKVERKQLFGLIGPDGAGKTTLFRILTTLFLPSSGMAFLEGYHTVKDYKMIRKIVGYMPGTFSLYQDLSVEENIRFFATIFGTTLQGNYDLVKPIYSQLEPFKNRKAGALSGGMKQKLALSCALIHRPKVLILDEPTTGVDAVSRQEFWEMLQVLKENNITIVVSTPYMEEAAKCDKIGLIKNGNIKAINTPGEITKNYPHDLFEVSCSNNYKLLKTLGNMKEVSSAHLFGQSIHVTLVKNYPVETFSAKLSQSNCNFPGINIRLIQPTIQDCFLEMTKDEK